MNILIPMDFKHYIMGDDTTQHCQKTTEISFEHLCNFLVKKKKKDRNYVLKIDPLKRQSVFFPAETMGRKFWGLTSVQRFLAVTRRVIYLFFSL